MPKNILISKDDELVADTLDTFVILTDELKSFSNEIFETAVDAGCQGNDSRVKSYAIKIAEIENLIARFQDTYTDLKIKIKESQLYSSFGSINKIVKSCTEIMSKSYDFSKLANNLLKLNKVLNRSDDYLKQIEDALKPKTNETIHSTSLRRSDKKDELTEAEKSVYARIENKISQLVGNQTVTNPEADVPADTENIDDLFDTIDSLKKKK